LLHAGAEEGGLDHFVRIREDSETLGINRRTAFLVEPFLRHPHSTNGVPQLVGESRTWTRGAMSAQHLEFVEDVLAVLELCPEQVHVGVVWVSLVMVFRLVALLALLRTLESEGSDDGRLGSTEGGCVTHLESNCRLVCLSRAT